VAGAIDQAMVSKLLNATTSATAFATLTAPFKVRLDSGTDTAAAAGTEITGGGYVAGGQTSTAPFASTSSAGSNVTIPHTAILTWTNASGGAWSVQSLSLVSADPTRTWFGNFTGAPVAVANGNTFQIAVDAIVISLT
jgi:hypothetical protein